MGELLDADDLELRGQLALGRHWTVPDGLDVRMEFKEKKGRLNAKLSWSWSTLGDL